MLQFVNECPDSGKSGYGLVRPLRVVITPPEWSIKIN
jgi:hypothetical protein